MCSEAVVEMRLNWKHRLLQKKIQPQFKPSVVSAVMPCFRPFLFLNVVVTGIGARCCQLRSRLYKRRSPRFGGGGLPLVGDGPRPIQRVYVQPGQRTPQRERQLWSRHGVISQTRVLLTRAGRGHHGFTIFLHGILLFLLCPHLHLIGEVIWYHSSSCDDEWIQQQFSPTGVYLFFPSSFSLRSSFRFPPVKDPCMHLYDWSALSFRHYFPFIAWTYLSFSIPILARSFFSCPPLTSKCTC